MDIQKQLLNQFEISYKEYKDYADFYERNNKSVMEGMAEQVKDIISSPDDIEKAAKFILDTRTTPTLYATDLNNLKERVLAQYDLIKDVVEIPQEARKVLEERQVDKNKLMYIIDKGNPVEVNPELIQKYKSQITPQTVQNVIKAFSNITDIDKL